jgi:hypothetical protein
MVKTDDDALRTWRKLEEDAALASGMTFRLVYTIASGTRAPVYARTIGQLEEKRDALFAGCSAEIPFEYYLARTGLQLIEAHVEEHSERGWQPIAGTARRAVWHMASRR